MEFNSFCLVGFLHSISLPSDAAKCNAVFPLLYVRDMRLRSCSNNFLTNFSFPIMWNNINPIWLQVYFDLIFPLPQIAPTCSGVFPSLLVADTLAPWSINSWTTISLPKRRIHLQFHLVTISFRFNFLLLSSMSSS